MTAAAIFFTALLVRSVYLIQYLHSPLYDNYGVDHVYYLEWARRIAAGDWLGAQVFEQTPLYAYGLGAFFSLFGEHIVPVLIIQMLMGAGGCVLVYACGRRLFDEPIALLAGIGAALYGPFVFYEVMPMKSFLSPLFSILALYAGLRYGEGSRLRWLLLAGVAVGLACLVRENHILLLMPLALWIWSCRPAAARRRLGHIAIASLGAVLVLAPVTLRNAYLSGEFVLVTAGGGEVFYIAQGPMADGYYRTPDFVLATAGVEHEDFRREAEKRTGRALSRAESSRYWFHQGLQSVFDDPLRALGLTLKKAAILFNDFEVPDSASCEVTARFVPVLNLLPGFGWISGLGLLGLALCLKDWRRYQLAIGIAAVHILTVLLLYNFGRFRLGMMPVWILFAAYGTFLLIRTIVSQKSPKPSTWAALAATVLLTAASFYPLQPVRYEVYAAQLTGTLAARIGDYGQAERQLRRALALFEREVAADPTTTQAYDLARIHQELARVLSETGRYDQAVAQFQAARCIPLRADLREAFLRHELAVLHETIPIALLTRPGLDPRAEAETILAELRALRPDSIEYWAISAFYVDNSQSADAVAAGLETAWQGTGSPHDEAWYRMGRSLLADFSGKPATAADQARRALRLWPQHPFREQLQALAARAQRGRG